MSVSYTPASHFMMSNIMIICPSVCLSVCLSLCPSVLLSVSLFIHPSVHPSIRPFIRLSVHVNAGCSALLLLQVWWIQLMRFSCFPAGFSYADHLHFITWRSASARGFWQKRAGGGGIKHQKKWDSNENHIVIPHSRSAGEQQRPTDDLKASDVSDPLRRSRCDDRWPPLM